MTVDPDADRALNYAFLEQAVDAICQQYELAAAAGITGLEEQITTVRACLTRMEGSSSEHLRQATVELMNSHGALAAQMLSRSKDMTEESKAAPVEQPFTLAEKLRIARQYRELGLDANKVAASLQVSLTEAVSLMAESMSGRGE